MHMKYFQALAQIENHYDDILQHIEDPKYGHLLLETWDINPSEKDQLIEEREALRYLIACQGMMAWGEENVRKPEIHVMNRCLERHLGLLEKVHKCHAYNVNQHRLKTVQKQYKACRHYLFQFSLPAWYKRMPEEVLTFENTYPHHR